MTEQKCFQVGFLPSSPNADVGWQYQSVGTAMLKRCLTEFGRPFGQVSQNKDPNLVRRLQKSLRVFTHFGLVGLDKGGKVSLYKKDNVYSKSKLQTEVLALFFVFLRGNEYSATGTLSA